MAIFHATLFFANGSAGWVEQFHRQDGSLAASLAATVALASARWSILGTPCNLYRVRVSQVGVPRCSVSTVAPGAPLAVQAGHPDVAAEIRLTAGGTGLYRRSYVMRGLPADAFVSPQGVVSFAPAYAAAIRAWLALLLDGSWSLQCWGRSSPQYPLLGLTPIEGGFVNFGVGPDSGLAPAPLGDAVLALVDGSPVIPPTNPGTAAQATVRIGRAKWSTGRNGYRNGVNGAYLAYSSDTGQIVYAGSLPSEGEYLSGGYAQVRPSVYVPITSTNLVRVVVRKTGRAPINLGPAPSPLAPPADLAGGRAALVTILGSLLSPFSSAAMPYFNPTTLPPFIPAPVVPPPPPPLPPGPVVSPPPPLRPFLLTTLGDVGRLIATYMNGSYGPPAVGKLMTCRITNLNNFWLVVLGGTDAQLLGTTGFLAAYQAVAGLPNPMFQQALSFIEDVVPENGTVLIIGYSQGGAAAENLSVYVPIQKKISAVVTLAAPVPGIGNGLWSTQRFRTLPDIVPELSIWGFLGSFGIPPLYHIFSGDPAHFSFPACHVYFPVHPGLENFDPWGQPAGQHLPIITDTPVVVPIQWPT
jgi:hypothetical protein